MLNRCVRCHRRLKNPPSKHGMGPDCERAMYGTKPRRVAREERRSDDERQRELFGAMA